MSIVDVAALLQEKPVDGPCGANLEFSPDFIELGKLMQGTPDVQYGDMHVQAADPDWKAVKAKALALLQQSHDIRLAIYLTRSLTALHGMAGLGNGLALIDGMIERHWSGLHPALDPDDDDDPTERANTLAALEDPQGIGRQVLHCTLVEAPGAGRICLRDIETALGMGTAIEGETVRDEATLESIFRAAPLDSLAATAAEIGDAQGHLQNIQAQFVARVGHLDGIAFPSMQVALRRAGDWFQAQLRLHPDAIVHADADGSPTVPGQVQADPYDLHSRGDVARTLDLICDYYARKEPASPVPLLLQRARRLVDMDFLEIMNDLAPQSVPEIQNLAGIAG